MRRWRCGGSGRFRRGLQRRVRLRRRLRRVVLGGRVRLVGVRRTRVFSTMWDFSTVTPSSESRSRQRSRILWVMLELNRATAMPILMSAALRSSGGVSPALFWMLGI